MDDRRLIKLLDGVAARIRQVRLGTGLALVWLASAAVGLAVLWLNRTAGVGLGFVLPCLLAASLAAALLCTWLVLRSARDPHWLAQRVEAAYPDLDSTLLTAIEQKPSLPGGHYGFLQEHVLRAAFYHAYKHPWRNVVPTSRMVAAHVANGAAACLLLASLAALVLFTAPRVGLPAATPFSNVVVVEGATFQADIEPGNTEVERGTSLLVLARFQGPLPPEATLIYQIGENEPQSVKMTKSLDDPVFGGRIVSVEQPARYHVEFGDQSSAAYDVTVFEYPALARADARLVFPQYTQMEERLVQDVRRVSAVEGTELTLLCYLNKQVAEAQLLEPDHPPIELSPAAAETAAAAVADQGVLYTTTFKLDRSRRLELRLVDSEGRQNRTAPEFVINVLPNRPPDLKLAQPARDVQVSPIEELQVKATAWDDYGLARVGLSYLMPGVADNDVVLGESLPAKEKAAVDYLLAFEDLDAEPDQLLSYYFWAEDIGPDGKVRRTSSDMYFAEVRHFEEIFRQGQQPPGGQSAQQQQQQQQQQGGQNAREAERLADLQKQIINGTWKVIRRETRDELTSTFKEDVQLLTESQLSAIEQVENLKENLQDEQSLVYVEDVVKHMQQAAIELGRATEPLSVAPLSPALASEQAAYQALLKLRAREHEVVRANQQQQQQQQSRSASSSSSRSQQQLQQLQLRDDENRYETQQTAQPQESQQQREDRQVLNRLRELSRRQSDLNERIKELQSALEEAQTPEQKQEIERQLKRLRDEEQQILRDTEELQERMQQPENQQRMAEEQQQLDRVRENVRQSSEALREGMVSRAAAEGTRAERELRELRDEFQQRTSGQFSEEMRQMRQQARELDERERELAEQLNNLDRPREEAPTLRDADERQQVAEGLQQQQQGVEDLLDRMRQTVEEAETSEPLLAEQLYDTIRNTRRQNPGRSLESAERSLDRGFVQDARNEERQAREGITQLREGVDRAAESVLGNETEALERAKQELRELNRQLDNEIARNDPQAGERREGQPQDGQQNDGQQNDGQQNQGQQNQGQQNQGQRNGRNQQGQRQPGQRQPGERQPGQNGQRQDGQQPQDGQQQPGQGQRQPGDQQPQQNQEGQQPGQGQQPGEGQQPGQGQQGQPQQGQPQQGQPQQGQPQDGQQQPGQQPGQRGLQQPGQRNQQGGRGGPRGGDDRLLGPSGLDQFLDQGGEDRRPLAPFSGEDFLDWSDRLRDVEEMIADPELRAEAARIRDQAREIRKDVKRHSKPPNWDLVKMNVAEPLVELQRRVEEELLRRSSQDAPVPIDRDPVPAEYEQQVRRYYEQLGTGK